jgi:hypothetical protein
MLKSLRTHFILPGLLVIAVACNHQSTEPPPQITTSVIFQLVDLQYRTIAGMVKIGFFTHPAVTETSDAYGRIEFNITREEGSSGSCRIVIMPVQADRKFYSPAIRACIPVKSQYTDTLQVDAAPILETIPDQTVSSFPAHLDMSGYADNDNPNTHFNVIIHSGGAAIDSTSGALTVESQAQLQVVASEDWKWTGIQTDLADTSNVFMVHY